MTPEPGNAPPQAPMSASPEALHLADHLWGALDQTRKIHLALTVMRDEVDRLPDGAAAGDDVRAALTTLSNWLEDTESRAVREQLAARQYLVIRPVSLRHPPPPGAMAGITAAISVLDGHGLIVASGD